MSTCCPLAKPIREAERGTEVFRRVSLPLLDERIGPRWDDRAGSSGEFGCYGIISPSPEVGLDAMAHKIAVLVVEDEALVRMDMADS